MNTNMSEEDKTILPAQKDAARKKGAHIERFTLKCKDHEDHAIWQGRTDNRNRYGIFMMDGKNWRAHRAAWALFEGPIPAGAAVRSKCGLSLCVAPAHLELDTNPVETRVKV